MSNLRRLELETVNVWHESLRAYDALDSLIRIPCAGDYGWCLHG